MNSHDMMNQTRGVPMRRVAEPPDPNDRLLERILSRENMLNAWKQVKGNKGAAGIDRMTIDDFPAFARKNWDRIRTLLSEGIYQPMPVKRVEIPKPTGGTRPLGIPTITDRLIQQAIAQVLSPIFDVWWHRPTGLSFLGSHSRMVKSGGPTRHCVNSNSRLS
jgi:RNA-directed DNA polymerase